MARDRKRAKQRQRRAASRPQPPRRRAEREAEEVESAGAADPVDELEATDAAEAPPETREIPDLQHASADADIARIAARTGNADPDAVREALDEELGFADDSPPHDTGQEAAAERALGRRQEKARGGLAVVTFLRNSWAELRRVQWPDRRHTAQGTAVVLVFVLITGMFLGGMDFISQKLMDLIL